MNYNIVRRVKRLALPLIGNHRRGPVWLKTHNAPQRVLAGNLAALKVECIAVAVFRRRAENAHVAVFLDPAHLTIIRDVAKHQETSGTAPSRALGPASPCPQPLDGSIADDVFRES